MASKNHDFAEHDMQLLDIELSSFVAPPRYSRVANDYDHERDLDLLSDTATRLDDSKGHIA